MSVPQQNKKGFSLVELLVGMTLFSIIFAGIISVFVFQIRFQKRLLKKQEALGELSFAMEYMSRALRMVVKDEDGTCISSGFNYENPGGDVSAIQFLNHLQGDDCQKFFLQDSKLKYNKEGNKIFDLTSPNFEIEEIKFHLSGVSDSDDLQPKVTIFLKARFFDSSEQFKLQTTISQRNLDVN